MNIEKNWDMMAKAYEDFTEGEASYSYKKEPYPPEEWKESEKGRYDNFIETPTYMIMKLKKN